MLIDRRIFNVARTKMDDAVAQFTQLRSAIDWKRPTRIYVPQVAGFDQIVVEVEFADWAEMQDFWSEWMTSDEVAAFFVKWEECALPGGRRELWETVE